MVLFEEGSMHLNYIFTLSQRKLNVDVVFLLIINVREVNQIET